MVSCKAEGAQCPALIFSRVVLRISGLAVMAADLILGGLFQGWSWSSLQPWDRSIDVSFPFWMIRIWAGLSMFGGLVVFLYNFYMTWRSEPEAVPNVAPTPATA